MKHQFKIVKKTIAAIVLVALGVFIAENHPIAQVKSTMNQAHVKVLALLLLPEWMNGSTVEAATDEAPAEKPITPCLLAVSTGAGK